MVRFAHIADCHLGAWRDPKLSKLVEEAFVQVIDRVLAEEVDFVIIAGDLFNTALPPIDSLKRAVHELERLKQAGIPVYFVAGSHDYSPTGKTMLDVLEEASLATNVFQPTSSDDKLSLKPVVDSATGVSLAGILGRAGQLDKELFARLDTRSLEELSSPKVFVFHAALKELVSEQISGPDAHSVSLLPTGFDYYAGGHVHVTEDTSLQGYSRIVYPGPVFPASFSELEDLEQGGFCLVDLEADKVTRVPVVVREVTRLFLDCTDLAPEEVTRKLVDEITESVSQKIVLIRVSGRLARGTTSDIDFREVFAACTRLGAYTCLKNTRGVSSPQLLLDEEAPVSSAQEIERAVISDYAGSVELSGVEDQESLLHELISVLGSSPGEGETKTSFEDRVVTDALELLGVDKPLS